MKEINYWLLIFIGMSIFLLSTIIFVVFLYRMIMLSKTSQIIPKVKELNKKYKYCSVQPFPILIKHCKSKREFDRTNARYYLCYNISCNKDYFSRYISLFNSNNKIYNSYNVELSNLLSETSDKEKGLYLKYKWYKNLENKRVKKITIKPFIFPLLRVEIIYTSPQGRNQYCSYFNFSINDIISCYNDVELEEKNRLSAHYQRSMMSDSLRYDVMKRDGFKCVLCGASQKDGVKLHVDHILPISKGGKTIITNLRTLCEHCNLGKSDKYDFNGPN